MVVFMPFCMGEVGDTAKKCGAWLLFAGTLLAKLVRFST
jgi:hypothetical protein